MLDLDAEQVGEPLGDVLAEGPDFTIHGDQRHMVLFARFAVTSPGYLFSGVLNTERSTSSMVQVTNWSQTGHSRTCSISVADSKTSRLMSRPVETSLPHLRQ